MEAPRHGQLGARRGTALALLYALVAAAAPAAAEGTAAAVLVVAPEPRDRALAGQIEELLAAALDARGIRRARFGEEDVGVREETIRKQLDEALPRVTSGLRGQPFDEASAILNDAFFGAKQILGLVDPALLARLYKAFAAAQVTLGRTDLAEDYVAASLNMAPDQSPRSFQYFSAMERVVDAAHRRVTGPRTRVSIVAEPPDATIRVDGRDLGGSPVEIELTGGPHLLQVRAGGHHAQGWLKDAAAGDRWTITLRPVPGAARFDGLRDEGARGLRLERQALEAAAAGGATPPPACPSEVLTALGRLADAEHVVLAVVESAGDRIAVRGCHQVRGVVSPIALVLARDASLLEGLRAALEAGLAAGNGPPDTAVSAMEPARDPRLRRAEGLLGTVEDRLRALAARERQLRALGLGARVPRLRAARDPLEELLPALQEAVSIHGTDPALAARLLQDAEDRWGRMQNLLLSVDAWDPTGEARARDVQAASEEHTRAQQRLRDAGARWKAARSKLRDRALQKRFDQELKALQKQGAALSKEVAKAKDLRPWTARSTQLLVDAGGFLRAVDAAFEPPPPPPPSPPELVVPEVEPEPIPVVEPAVEPEPEPEPAP